MELSILSGSRFASKHHGRKYYIIKTCISAYQCGIAIEELFKKTAQKDYTPIY
jgi:hypothetical protein